jgi:hypothetical protein
MLALFIAFASGWPRLNSIKNLPFKFIMDCNSLSSLKSHFFDNNQV